MRQGADARSPPARHTRTGSIILERDGGGNRPQTVAALKIWLPRLLGAGCQLATP
jgi:hypothetical protein